MSSGADGGSGPPNSGQEFLPGFPTVDAYSQASLRQILLATKHSNAIPGEKKSDWDYYDTFSGFRTVMAKQNSSLREMIRSQFEYNGVKGRLGATDVAELVDMLSDANDVILERVSMNLDEAAGIRRDADPLLLEVSQSNVAISGSWNNFSRGKDKERDTSVKLLAAKNVLRPQMKFSKFVDNSTSAFQPRLTDKPHSMKPLSVLVEYDDLGKEIFSHPYIYEMERDQPVSSQLSITVPIKPTDIPGTSMMYVDTLEKLQEMIKELQQEEVIGLDVEHHNYRSYLGITCLIQISSVSKDYLVDPFPLWSELPILNEITANPKIVKVLHGCDHDVDWLQRDFSIYLRNVFDTHQAGKLLGFPRLSLAWLLSNYCGLEVDKQYQLADWRIRPLPKEMVVYARQDTRYMVYLYTRLKNELISKGNADSNLLHACLHQSNDICKKRFRKTYVLEDSHLDLVRKARANLNNKQLFCLKELYSWRDKTARVEDESVHYVLPNHMMLKISSELPREMQGIMACCNPIPPLVKQSLGTLHSILLAARDKQLLTVDPAMISSSAQSEMADFTSNLLQSPLDLSHLEDAGDLDTVVKNKFTFANNNLVKSKPDLSVFSSSKPVTRSSLVQFVSPFQRYTLLKPYLDSLEKQEDETNANTEKNEVRSNENIRMDSIKEHFEKLTEMTPKPKKKKVIVDDEDEDEVALSSDEEVEPKKPYFEDPKKPYVETKERIPNMRQGAQKANQKKPDHKNDKQKNSGCFKCGEEGHFARECTSGGEAVEKKQKKKFGTEGGGCFKCGENGHFARECTAGGDIVEKKQKKKGENIAEGHNKKQNLKRKGGEPNVVKTEKVAKTGPKEFDYNQVDFKNFGNRNNQNKDFDPNNTEKDHTKVGGKKKQQFNKRGSKSHTFKRS
eukprot:GFUD01023573.1.p1 GENE.GFUD01023573.1~~GFUD01023573.1.p1  ORF type:complete len:902 (-),score=286.05 GFUD01023573.1:77-2782(-)